MDRVVVSIRDSHRLIKTYGQEAMIIETLNERLWSIGIKSWLFKIRPIIIFIEGLFIFTEFFGLVADRPLNNVNDNVVCCGERLRVIVGDYYLNRILSNRVLINKLSVDLE